MNLKEFLLLVKVEHKPIGSRTHSRFLVDFWLFTAGCFSPLAVFHRWLWPVLFTFGARLPILPSSYCLIEGWVT